MQLMRASRPDVMLKPVPNVLFTIIHPAIRQGSRLWQVEPTIGLRRRNFAHDNWTAPLRVRRLRPHDNAYQVAIEQIKELLQEYPDDVPLAIFVFDAGLLDPDMKSFGFFPGTVHFWEPHLRILLYCLPHEYFPFRSVAILFQKDAPKP